MNQEDRKTGDETRALLLDFFEQCRRLRMHVVIAYRTECSSGGAILGAGTTMAGGMPSDVVVAFAEMMAYAEGHPFPETFNIPGTIDVHG